MLVIEHAPRGWLGKVRAWVHKKIEDLEEERVMNDELREAIDAIQDKIDGGRLIDVTSDEALLVVLEAARLYWYHLDEEYDGY